MDRRALDAAPVPTVILRDRRVIYVNPAASALAQVPSDSLIGRSFDEFIAPEDRERVADRQARRLRGEPVPVDYEVTLVGPTGLRRVVQIYTAVEDSDIVVQILDVSDRIAQRSRLTALARLGAAVQNERSDEGVLRAVHAGLAAMGLHAALLRPVGEALCVEFAELEPEEEAAFRAASGRPSEGLSLPFGDLCRAAWRDGAAYCDDAALEAARLVGGLAGERVREMALSGGRHRAVLVRIDAGGAPSAILLAAGAWPREGDLPAFQLFGTQVSAAMDAARTIRDLSTRNEELAALNRLAETAASAPDLPTFFRRGVEEVMRVLGCQGFAIWLLDEERGELQLAHEVGGTAETAAALRVPVAGTLVGQLAVEDVPRVFQREDYPEDIRRIVDTARFVSYASVPLRVRGRPVGVMNAAFRDRRDPRSARLDLLHALAGPFAAAVEAGRLLGSLRGRVSELTLLNDVAVAAAALDPATLLQNALGRILATLGADAGVAFLLEGEHLIPSASFGVSPETYALLSRIPADRGPAGESVRRLEPVCVPRMAEGGERSRLLHEREGMETAVAIPLHVKGRALGAIVVGRRAPRPFQDAEVALLATVAAQLGVAVENARLFADTRRQVQELEAVNALTLDVFGTPPGDTRALLAAASEEIGRALEASAVAFFLLDERGEVLRLAEGWGSPLPPAEAAISARSGTLASEALRAQRPVQIDDTSADPRSGMRGLPGTPSLSMLTVPLTSRRAPRGVVAIASEPGRRFGEAEVALAFALASSAAMGLENAELHAEARRRVADLSLVHEMGRTVAASLDLDRVLHDGAEAIRRLVDTSQCVVLLLDPARRELRYGSSTADLPADLRAFRMPLDSPSLASQAARERRPVASGDPSAQVGLSGEIVDRLGVKSALAAPLLLRGEPLGVVVADEARRARTFTQAEVDRVMAVASQLAVAIENARLYSEARRRAEELGLVLEVGRSLVATLEIRQVLDAGVRNLARIVEAPDAYLFLADPEGVHLELWAAAGNFPQLVGSRVPVSPPQDSLAALVFHRKEPLALESGAEDPAVHPDLLGITQGSAYLGLPLVVRDRTIGCALIVDPGGPRRFDAAEVERAAAIANQLAVAVENARLYDDLRRSYAELGRAQAQLVEQERLAALGEIAAVVAHEVRNPLGVVFNSLGSLRRMLRPEGDAKMLLDIIGEEADRLNRIVGDLLDFARPSTPVLRPEALDRLLDEAVSAALAENPVGIAVEKEVEAGMPPVALDARLVRQAILNVAVNAAQAMQKGGRLTVRARLDGAFARVELADTGPGIPEEVRHRIFEPFFTTKASGTGLGLAVVKRIVEGHRGEVSVSSPPGGGAVFTLRLPVEPPSLSGAPAPRAG
jgi:PAS domain S-box-containing protein